jgi:predicted flap endonuclease-1-like 5' DNA nuclease
VTTGYKTAPPAGVLVNDLERRLSVAQHELRRLGSERLTLRARLRQLADRNGELESALRAETELRRQAAEEHQTAISSMRTRILALESQERRAHELERQLNQVSEQLVTLQVRILELEAPPSPAAARSAQAPEGLRRIRGIGPAYQRALEALGVTELEQLAKWSEDDISRFADKLKIRRERIVKDDWVGQAKQLCGPS